jgi:hypothetical protein
LDSSFKNAATLLATIDPQSANWGSAVSTPATK